ncbi:potassium channel family protein [Nostoc sp.]|uniref:potassium channel family protein n=1 Tax=Nostoc sp. TaxID=1180 RepID=UPI002FEF440D
MQDLLPKERRFSFGSISTKALLILGRILLFGSVFIYSGLIYKFENPHNSLTFRNFWDALYFTVVTMATVGFGDVIPKSICGHILTVLMIFTGAVLIPWQLGDLIKQVVKTATQVEKDCLALDCGLTFHDENAGFCKRCGAKLPT